MMLLWKANRRTNTQLFSGRRLHRRWFQGSRVGGWRFAVGGMRSEVHRRWFQGSRVGGWRFAVGGLRSEVRGWRFGCRSVVAPPGVCKSFRGFTVGGVRSGVWLPVGGLPDGGSQGHFRGFGGFNALTKNQHKGDFGPKLWYPAKNEGS